MEWNEHDLQRRCASVLQGEVGWMHTPQIIKELCLQGAALSVSNIPSSKGMADAPSGLAFHKAEKMGN